MAAREEPAENRQTEFDAEALHAKLDQSFAHARAFVASWLNLDVYAVPSTVSTSQPFEVRPPGLGLGAHPSDITKTSLIDNKLHAQLLAEARKKQREALSQPAAVATVKRKAKPPSDEEEEEESRVRAFSKKKAGIAKDAFKMSKPLARISVELSTPPASTSSTATSLNSPPAPIASTSKLVQDDTENFSLQDDYMHSSFDEDSASDLETVRPGSPDRPRVPFAPQYDDSSDEANEPRPPFQQHQAPLLPPLILNSSRTLLNLDGATTGGATNSDQRKKRKRKKKRKSDRH